MDKTAQKFFRDTENDCGAEADPAPPEWKVFFHGGFWGHRGRDRAGKEIRLDRQFDWAEHHWVVPAAYACGRGLVLDLCMRAEAGDIRRFMGKWDLHPENDSCENFSREQQLQIDLDNPLCLDILPQPELNGKILQVSHGCAVSYNPCLPEESEAKWVLEHYGLDASYGWMIWRCAFLWPGKRRPEVKSLALTMEQEPRRVPGPHFRIHAPGDSFVFSHPADGREYTLTVQEVERQSTNHWRCPMYFTAMSYTLSPKTEDISIYDCAEGDKPPEIPKRPDYFAPEAKNDYACIGVIGGADGPIAIVTGNGAQGSLHAVCSALRLRPPEDDVEWRVEFRVRQFGAERFPLK